MKYFYLSILFLSALPSLWSQIPTTQDCLGSIPVCEQIYTESTAPSGFGNYAGEIDPNISCVFDDNNSIWYTFTVNSSGNFGFILTPNDLNDDYDWALYNLTNATCSDILRLPELLVSCNAAGGGPCQGETGANGSSRYNNQGGGCESDFPDQDNGQSAFNNFIPVIAGNTYTLMVSNWTGSTNGYEIDFGVSEDIGIIDRTPPEIKSVTLDRIDGCSPREITLEFSEFIQCNSIDLANFLLQDSDGDRYDIEFSSPICDVGSEYSRSFRITLMEPLQKIMETYSLIASKQTTLKILDVCGNEVIDFSSDFEVTLPQLADVTLPLDTLVCNMPSVTLDVYDPNALSYTWQDGNTSSDYVASTSGTYDVTVSNTCQELQVSIDVLIVNNQSDIVALGPDTILCGGTSYTLDPNLNIEYTYNWNDGVTERIRNISENGTFSVTVSDQCGIIGEDEITIEFIDRSLTLDLGESALLCSGETLELSVHQDNAIDYLWSDGSSAPTLSVRSGGRYAVTVSNECETIQDEIIVNESSCTQCNIYIPNAIAPTGMAKNREFKIISNCILESYSMSVFDRWGAEIFVSKNPSISWQGFDASNSIIENGIYIYVVSYSYFEFDELISKVDHGDVLVIR